jgi:hypothetical protein
MTDKKLSQETVLVLPKSTNRVRATEDPAGTPVTGYTTFLDILKGWIYGPSTWFYATASSFTVAGDMTAVYTKGLKIKWKQGGVTKYGIVLSSSAVVNTTVNIVVNDDYVLANSAITEMAYSYMDNPQGFPDWFNYTPIWTGFSVDPAATCRFRVTGKACVLMVYPNTGGTSNTTSFTMSAPIVSGGAMARMFVPIARAQDNSAYLATACLTLPAGSSTITFYTTMTTYAGWTASGTKLAGFEIVYEI